MSEEQVVGDRDSCETKDHAMKLIEDVDLKSWISYFDSRCSSDQSKQDGESEFSAYIKNYGFDELVQHIESNLFPELIKHDLVNKATIELHTKLVQAQTKSNQKKEQAKEAAGKGFQLFSFSSLWNNRKDEKNNISSVSGSHSPDNSADSTNRATENTKPSITNLIYKFLYSSNQFERKHSLQRPNEDTSIISAISGTPISTDTLKTVLTDIFTTKHNHGFTVPLHENVYRETETTTIFDYSRPKLITDNMNIVDFWQLFAYVVNIVDSLGFHDQNINDTVLHAIQRFYDSPVQVKPTLLHLDNLDTFITACEDGTLCSFMKQRNIHFNFEAKQDNNDDSATDFANKNNHSKTIKAHKNEAKVNVETIEDALITIMSAILSSIQLIYDSYKKDLQKIIDLQTQAEDYGIFVGSQEDLNTPRLISLLVFSSGGLAIKYSSSKTSSGSDFALVVNPTTYIFKFKEKMFGLLGGARNGKVVTGSAKMVYVHPPSESSRRVMFMKSLREAIQLTIYKRTVELTEQSLNITKQAINMINNTKNTIVFNKDVLLSPLSSTQLLVSLTYNGTPIGNGNDTSHGLISIEKRTDRLVSLISTEKKIDRLISLLAKKSRYATEETIRTRVLHLFRDYIWNIIPSLGDIAEMAWVLAQSKNGTENDIYMLIERLNKIPSLESFIISNSVVFVETVGSPALNNSWGGSHAHESYAFISESEFKNQKTMCAALESLFSKRVMIDEDYDENVKEKRASQTRKRQREIQKDFIINDSNKKQKTTTFLDITDNQCSASNTPLQNS